MEAFGPSVRPHPGQRKMLGAALAHTFCVWVVGRRWGKTLGAVMLLYIEGLRYSDGVYKAAYCAPTYKRAREVYEWFVKTFRPLIAYKRDTDLVVEMKAFGLNTGAKLFFWSLEQHDNLRGEGLARVIIDECADVVANAYYATLLPMIADGKGGKVLLIGTPKRVGVGFVWFRNEFLKGEDEDETEHVCGHGPSEGNPHLSHDMLRQLREQCIDDLTRREEYDAEWITEEGAVFERLDEAFVLPVTAREGNHVWIGQGPRPNVKYVMGVDLARFEDYTVASIFDRETRHQVAVLRIRREEYDYQLQIIHKLRKRYNDALIVADATGVGAAITEKLLRRYSHGVLERKWNVNTKEEDITRARLLFQDLRWKFLDIPWQRGEFQAYTRVIEDKSGNRLLRPRYEAPSGMHDDAVAAACIVSEQVNLPYMGAPSARREPHLFSLEGLERAERKAKWSRYFSRLYRRA